MKTKIRLLTIVLALFAHNVRAQTALDIDAAVNCALANNLSLECSRAETGSARRKMNRSWNGLTPSLSVGAVVMKPMSVTGTIPSPNDEWKEGFTLSAGAQFSPEIIAGIKQTKAEYEAGLLSYAAARQELDYQVRCLYYQLLLLRANTELMEQNVWSARGRHEQTVARQQAGQASNLDELSARLDAQTQQINFQNAVSNYENALDSFKHLLLIPQEERITLAGSLAAFNITDYDIEKAMANESMQTGILRKSIEALEAQKTAAQAGAYAPALSVSWNTNPLYSNSAGKWSDSGQLSVSLSMKLDNILPWSPAKETIDTIDDAITRQYSQLREAVLNHQNALHRLRRNMTQSFNTIDTLRLNIILAEETYRMYDEAYRGGTADLQNLNSARDSLSAAQNKLLSEQYNLALAVLELEKEINIPFGSLLEWE